MCLCVYSFHIYMKVGKGLGIKHNEKSESVGLDCGGQVKLGLVISHVR